MARIDKVVQVVRGVAGSVIPASGSIHGVMVAPGGSVVFSNGGTCDGVVVPNANRGAYGTVTAVGERVDILRIGEVVEYNGPGSAGNAIYAGTGGVLTTTPAGNTKIGVLMDGGKRLVVAL